MIEHRENVEPLLHLNHAQRTSPSYDNTQTMRPVARLDNVTYYKLLREGKAPSQDYKAFRKWLEENPFFKTTERKLWIPK